jgi:hypothetical protein
MAGFIFHSDKLSHHGKTSSLTDFLQSMLSVNSPCWSPVVSWNRKYSEQKLSVAQRLHNNLPSTRLWRHTMNNKASNMHAPVYIRQRLFRERPNTPAGKLSGRSDQESRGIQLIILAPNYGSQTASEQAVITLMFWLHQSNAKTTRETLSY